MADFSGVRLLVFRVAELTCAAAASTVREILPAQAPTRVPGTAPQVAGLINVRGELFTLVDGRRALGRPPTDTQGPTVLLEVGGRTVGLTVDEVLDLLAVPADRLVARHDLAGLDPAVVRGVGRRDGGSFVLLDLDTLLGPIMRREEA